MARFEYVEGGSQKFWEIEVDGRWVTTRWGRLGTRGQRTSRQHADAETADRRAKSLVRQKRHKGYRQVDFDVGDVEAAPGHPELEAAIADAPNDPAPRLVYADWLMAQDASLGRLITLEAAHHASGDDTLLSEIAQLRRACAGPIADRRAVVLTWKLGLIWRARLQLPEAGADALSALVAVPAARVLRELTFDTKGPTEAIDSRERILRALVAAAPSSLRRLRLRHRGGVAKPRRYAEEPLDWSGLPGLHTLLVDLPNLTLPRSVPPVRNLAIVVPRLPDAMVAVARCRWDQLEHVHLSGPTGQESQLAALADLAAPRLRSLALQRASLRDTLGALEATPFWAHLERLELIDCFPDAATVRQVAARTAHIPERVHIGGAPVPGFATGTATIRGFTTG